MPNFASYHNEDLRYYARDALCTLPENAEYFGYNPADGPAYEDALRQAFNFLRRHDDGRYSSRMKMRVLNAAESAEAARDSGAGISENLPGVAGLRVPFSYDEDTEVKSGGLLAVAVAWPTESGRFLLSVHNGHRRERLGSLMLGMLRYPVQMASLTSWVNRANVVGQHFLLSGAFQPSGFNQSGGVCWTWGDNSQDEGVEDHIDPLEQVRPRRRRTVEVPASVVAETRDRLREALDIHPPVAPEPERCDCDDCRHEREMEEYEYRDTENDPMC